MSRRGRSSASNLPVVGSTRDLPEDRTRNPVTARFPFFAAHRALSSQHFAIHTPDWRDDFDFHDDR